MTSRLHLLAALAVSVALLAPTAAAQTSSLPSDDPRPGPEILYWPLANAPQLENRGIWQASPILISGASAYRDGEFLYQDFLYDDRGAAAPGAVGSGGTAEAIAAALGQGAHGTYVYPLDPVYARNAADIVEIRLKPLAAATALRITYNSLMDPERVATTLALGSSPLPRAMPHGANASMPAEVFVTVHGASGDITDAASGLPVAGVPPTVTVDTERRQVEVLIPHAAFDPRGQMAVRVAAATGLWDPALGQYAIPHSFASNPPTGDPTSTRPGGAGLLASPPAFFNVAFRFSEPATSSSLPGMPSNVWREMQQASVLATGNLSPFFASVDFTKLEAQVDDDMSGQPGGVPQSGYMTRILASHFEDAQGRGSDPGGDPAGRYPCDAPTCIPQFSGRLQPYEIYVPTRPPPAEGYGLTLSLHGCGANYNAFLSSQRQVQYGERGTGSIVITGLARGSCYWYYDEAGADIFEIWADVATRYPLDPEYTAITGASMGGYGSYKLAAQFPDLFARAGPVEGCPSAGTLYAGPGTAAPGGEASLVYHVLRSLRNLPLLSWNMTDEICLTSGQIPIRDTLDALGYRYEYYTLSGDHVAGAANDQEQRIADYFGAARVDRNPPHITYVVNSQMSQPRYGLTADHVYWLSGLRLRDETLDPPLGTIDARSHGFGVGDPPPGPTETGSGVVTGGVFPAIAYTVQSKDWGPAPPEPVESRLDIETTNISAATIHVERARVSELPLTLHVKGDGPADVGLRGEWDGPVAAARDGSPFGLLVPADETLLLSDDFSGTHVYVLGPDLDGDVIPNAVDNCPALANPDQEDRGGVNTTDRDGIGDACQCGDVTGNGIVNGQDGLSITRFGLGYEDLNFMRPGNCDVTGNGHCNGQDGFFVTRAGLGLLDPLTVAPRGQSCPNATGAPCSICP